MGTSVDEREIGFADALFALVAKYSASRNGFFYYFFFQGNRHARNSHSRNKRLQWKLAKQDTREVSLISQFLSAKS